MTVASLVAAQLLGSAAAVAQAPATRPAPAEPPAQKPAQKPSLGRPVTKPALPSRPTTKPLPAPDRPVTKPVPLPGRPPITRPPPRPTPVPSPGPGWGGGGSGGSWGGSGGSWGDNWNDWNGRIVRCESWNYRYARCNLDTRGGVRLTRLIAGDCRQGRTWGWDTRQNFVWVSRGCRADFQSRYGNWGGGNDGPSTGAVIAGVAVAAGLIALLASTGRKPDAAATGAAQSAAVNIATGAVPAAAETSFRLCVNEAARQIGATGGTAIRLIGAVDTAPGNGGWRFQIPLEGTWPGDTHPVRAFCRATNTQVVELSFPQA